MRIALIVLIFSSTACYSQDIEMQCYRDTTQVGGSDIYYLKVFNPGEKPVALRTSIYFSKFNEKDTLQLGVSKASNNNTQICFYSIDESLRDLDYSEDSHLYSLAIINPQTYLLSKVMLVDNSCSKTRIGILYTDELDIEEIKNFTGLNGKPIVLSKKQRNFKGLSIELNK